MKYKTGINIFDAKHFSERLPNVQCKIEGGIWYPARPWGYSSIFYRIKAMWLVWKQEADLITWKNHRKNDMITPQHKEEDKGWENDLVELIEVNEGSITQILDFVRKEITKAYSLGMSVGTYNEGEKWGELCKTMKEKAYQEGYKQSQEDMQKALTED